MGAKAQHANRSKKTNAVFPKCPGLAERIELFVDERNKEATLGIRKAANLDVQGAAKSGPVGFDDNGLESFRETHRTTNQTVATALELGRTGQCRTADKVIEGGVLMAVAEALGKRKKNEPKEPE